MRGTSSRRSYFFATLLSLLLCSAHANAQLPPAPQLPVIVDVAGDTASIEIGLPGFEMADVQLTFDEATGVSASSLGVSAKLVSLLDLGLLLRLPSSLSVSIPNALPLLVTIEPPADGGLSFERTVEVELHTHLLPYTANSPFRIFKAPLGGPFVDITREVAPGSVRTRGTSGTFSQFLVLIDLRPSTLVATEKFTRLRAALLPLPAGESAPLHEFLDDAQAALDDDRYADAIVLLDSFTARVSDRAGTHIPETWRAQRDVTNTAGELLAGAATLRFTLGVLRDYGN